MRLVRVASAAALVMVTAALSPAEVGAQSAEQLQQQIQELERTIDAQGAQRERILASLDEVEAQVADLNAQVAQAGVAVAEADSELVRASSRLDLAARELYKHPQRRLGTLLSARSLNEFLVAQKYLASEARTETDAFARMRAAKDEQKARRDELVAKRTKLQEANAKKYEFRDAIDESVAAEQAMLAELQKQLQAAIASGPVTLSLLEGLPTAQVMDCPGSGAGKIGGNPKANAEFQAVYSKYPFGPVAAIPAGFEAVGPPTTEVHTWYGDCFHGHATASGAVYDQNLYTAAALKYPLGTFLIVTYPPNSRSMLVYINDRGPFGKGRSLDLSAIGAATLGTLDKGVATVTAQVVRPTY